MSEPYAQNRVRITRSPGRRSLAASPSCPSSSGARPPRCRSAAPPGLDLAGLETLPSKTIVLGVLDLGDPAPETPDVVARRLDAALRRVPAARLVAAPDCGMKYLPREVAFAKLQALAEGARRVG